MDPVLLPMVGDQTSQIIHTQKLVEGHFLKVENLALCSNIFLSICYKIWNFVKKIYKMSLLYSAKKGYASGLEGIVRI